MPPTPKVKTQFTNAVGERVTSYTDGTKNRVAAPGTTSPVPVETPITANNVPMSSLATTQESLTLPTPNVPNPDVQSTLSAGRQVTESFAQAEQKKAELAGNKYSQSEQNLRSMFNVLGTESDTRNELEQQKGVDNLNVDLTNFQNQLRRNLADLDQFDVDNVNTIEQMRVDASKRDVTKRTFNAMSAEAGIQNAVQRANMVAQTRATIAAIDVAQGNLTAATDQVDKALKAIYDPVRMGITMETQFLQNNLSLFTTAQTTAANARIKAMEQEVKEIDRAIDMVDSAVNAGYATADDIQKMVGMKDPELQRTYAQTLIANGIKRARDEAIAAAAASAANQAPDIKNIKRADGTEVSMQWNPGSGQWEEVSAGATSSADTTQKTIDQLTFLRDTASRITGGTASDGETTYDALYKASAPNPIAEFVRQNVGSSATEFTRLQSYADTLRVNVMALMQDPNIKKFFGPQMSNADVALMTSAGTSLRVGDQTPDEILEETTRLDNLLNRMLTAVESQSTGTPVNFGLPPNLLTAPDGTQVLITDWE